MNKFLLGPLVLLLFWTMACCVANGQPGSQSVCVDCYRPATSANCSTYVTPTAPCSISECDYDPEEGGIVCNQRTEKYIDADPFLDRVRLVSAGETGSDCYELREKTCLHKRDCDCSGRIPTNPCGIIGMGVTADPYTLHDMTVSGAACQDGSLNGDDVPAPEDER